MTQFTSPAGRMVQGGCVMQHQKDAETGKPLFNDDGTPQMGIFFSLAFPKVIPDHAGNPEWDAFWALLKTEAATAWPSLFPQGANGNCTHPRFSYKYQDGDGVDASGKPVSGKPGFAGHHIVKFNTAYPVRCFMDGQFSPHQELQKPDDTIKRGDWVLVIGDVRGNNATGTQVPGISIYPSALVFKGQDPVAGRISSGPDVAAVMAQHAGGYVPAGVSTHPAVAGAGVPAVSVPAVGVPAVAVPAVGVPAVSVPAVGVPAVSVPAVGVPPAAVVPTPAAPQYVIAPALGAQGVTIEALLKQGWTLEAAAAQGHVVKL